MNNLKIENITISELPWNVKPTKSKIIIDEDPYPVCKLDHFKDYISNINKVKEIESSDIVWIDPTSDVPLREFKKNYKNVITKDITKAHCIVINKRDLDIEYIGYTGKYTFCSNNTWTADEDVINLIGTSQVEDFVETRYVNNFDTIAEIKDRKVIHPINLLIGRGELSDDLGLKLDSLINSEDKEMHELGLKMLTTINISENVERIASIIIDAETFSRRYKGSRFIVSCIEDNMLDFQCRSFPDKLTFFIKLLVKNPKDALIIKKFNDLIKKSCDLDNEIPEITISTV